MRSDQDTTGPLHATGKRCEEAKFSHAARLDVYWRSISLGPQRRHQLVNPPREVFARFEESLVTPGGIGLRAGIFDGPVLDALRARPGRTILRRRITHGDHHIEVLVEKLIGTLGFCRRDVGAKVGHGANGHRVNPAGGTGAGRFDLQLVTVIESRQRIGHLASHCVARAKKENSLFSHSPILPAAIGEVPHQQTVVGFNCTRSTRGNALALQSAMAKQVKLSKFYDLVEDIETAMFTTRRSDGMLVSRPMATQAFAEGADLWFVTAKGSPKLSELKYDANVNLAYFKTRSREWVSVAGRAKIVRDRAKIHELYRPDWRAWFGDEGGENDGGPDDPRLVLIGVNVRLAMYLKLNKPQPVVLFEVMKGMVTGERPDFPPTKTITATEARKGRPKKSSAGKNKK